MKINRAYSILRVKSFSETEGEEERIIEGIASTPNPDRSGDIVEPLGAIFKNPMPLLWQHQADQPVGTVEFAKPTKNGIAFRARLPKIEKAGRLKDRVDEAWDSITTGLVTGVSIGFNSSTYDIMSTGGVRFIEWECFELSLVTIPANADATIQTIKSIDRKTLAATGTSKGSKVVKLQKTAGVTATKPNPIPSEKSNMKTFKEQLEDLRATRVLKATRLQEIVTKNMESGETSDAAQATEFDDLQAEIEAIDGEIKRVEFVEKMNIATAKPVDGSNTSNAAASRGNAVQLKEKSEPGIEFARYVGVLSAARGNRMEALEIAKARFPNQEKLHNIIKAAVAAGTTTDPQWAGNLVEYQTLTNDFLEYLRPRTLIGQFGQGNVPALRKVPFNVRIRSQVSTASASWVGEGGQKPLTKAGYDNITLGFAKIATIAVLTEELLRFSSPSAEALIRDELARAVIERMDRDFIDPAKALVSGESPASITNGVTPLVSSGSTVDDIDADIQAAFNAIIAGNQDPSQFVWIMDAVTALAISQKKNALGQKAFPDLTMLGGLLEGLPVIVSQYVPQDTAGHMIVLANASEILVADDGQVVVDASREATLNMVDTTTSGAATHSLWQHNEVAFRAERFINWRKARSNAVVYISGVNYGG